MSKAARAHIFRRNGVGAPRRAAPRSSARSASGEPTAEQVFRMPSRQEVERAGYRYADVQREFRALAKRFNSDPEFRAGSIQMHRDRLERERAERAARRADRRPT